MNLDLALILLVLTVVSGVIWLIDKLLFESSRLAAFNKKNDVAVNDKGEKILPEDPVLVEYAKSFFPVLVFVLIIRSFLAEPFRIPSSSMMPTLLIGDFILVNKFEYGIRLPAFNNKVIDIGEPERGDVVVFRFPEDESQNYIKRVVGLPGDDIVYRNRIIYVNGQPVSQKHLKTYVGTDSGANMTGASLREEQLGDATHNILLDHRRPIFMQPYFLKNQPAWDGHIVVPEGQYFVMGDNRDHSSDGRFWGFVPEENLVGEAFFIWMNWDAGINFERIGTLIK